MEKTKFDPNTLNQAEVKILWFDDFNGDEGKEPTNQYRFLSNFYVGKPLTLPGVNQEFMTGEHAFQAFKTNYSEVFLKIANAPSPSLAKKRGRTCTLRPDWERIKFDVMAAVVRAKFELKRAEGEMLLSTGDALLIEGTYWGDEVWGVDLQKAGTPGRNWLGTLLMARRAELIAESTYGLTAMHGIHNIKFAEK